MFSPPVNGCNSSEVFSGAKNSTEVSICEGGEELFREGEESMIMGDRLWVGDPEE